ncbi:MAG: hypothetical protein CM1200mP18_17910 [Gammaproteobacteria bacterium]|nr:MAG: hypothetical protein CM1200mP18_17910 [Gammaproteobacteria bacterium]
MTQRAETQRLYLFQWPGRDIITSAGYRIGPSNLKVPTRHEAVAEAAGVGFSDELRGEIVKAFVVLKAGYDPSPGTGPKSCVHSYSPHSPHMLP